jgi:hypothetical protein
MVQFLSFDEDRRVIYDKNNYWKLGLREYQNARKTIKYLEEHGYRCRENVSKAVASDAVGRYQRGLMSYEGLSVSELRSLCKAKGLSSKAKTASRLARALEKADDSATFRLLDLPPEIRNMIYELHLSDLGEINTCYAQPPLTLASRQLRAEALLLFLGCATFVFTIDKTLIPDMFFSEDHFTGCSAGLLSMLSASLSQVKNFKLTWGERVYYTRGRHWFELMVVHFTQRRTTGKAFTVTNSYCPKLDETLVAIVHDFGYWEDDFKLQREHIDLLKVAAAKVLP